MMYILQKAHLTHGRLGILPNALDIFFNFTQKKVCKLDKNNHLQLAKNGNFFLMGVKHRNEVSLSFIQAVAIALELTFTQVFDALSKALKNKAILLSLEEGDVLEILRR